MFSDFYILIYLSTIIFTDSLLFFYIALKILIESQPVILSNQLTSRLRKVALFPLLVLLSIELYRQNVIFQYKIFTLVLLALILITLFIRQKEYVFYGASSSYLREALLASAKSLGFSVEENSSCLTIKKSREEIQGFIQGWIRQPQIRPKGKVSDETVHQLVTELKNYFNHTPQKIHALKPHFFLSAAIVYIAISIVFIYYCIDTFPKKYAIPEKTQ